jgi:hypothetical protein
MSGYRSKKLSSNSRDDRGLEITGLTIEQVELLDSMWGFDTEDDLVEWQESLPLRLSQQVDSLIILVLLEQFDRILNNENDYSEANEVISKFTLH